MFIKYDGTNGEQIRAAINAVKFDSTIVVVEVEGGLRFDQIWYDGQISEDRWRIQPGQHLNAGTLAVVDKAPAP